MNYICFKFHRFLNIKKQKQYEKSFKINQNIDFETALLKNLKIMTWSESFFVKFSFQGLQLKECNSYLTTDNI